MAADNANDEGAFGFGFETPECGKMVFLFFFLLFVCEDL
jgi:hypothetical protein